MKHKLLSKNTDANFKLSFGLFHDYNALWDFKLRKITQLLKLIT